MYKKGRMNRVRKEKATFRNLDKEMLNIIEYNSWGMQHFNSIEESQRWKEGAIEYIYNGYQRGRLDEFLKMMGMCNCNF